MLLLFWSCAVGAMCARQSSAYVLWRRVSTQLLTVCSTEIRRVKLSETKTAWRDDSTTIDRSDEHRWTVRCTTQSVTVIVNNVSSICSSINSHTLTAPAVPRSSAAAIVGRPQTLQWATRGHKHFLKKIYILNCLIMYQNQTRPKCTILSQKIEKIWPVWLTKNSGSAPRAARKILQRGRKVTKHGTEHQDTFLHF